jgi:hypothetical protein
MVMRKSRETSLSETVILTEEDQSKLLEEISSEARKQTIFTRKAFAILYYLVAFLLTSTAIYSSLFPWDLHHQKYFKPIVSEGVFSIFYIGSIFCVLVSSLIVDSSLCSNRFKSLLHIVTPVSYVFAISNCIYWLQLYWRFEVSNPALYWLPFIDLGALLLASYVDRDCSGLLSSAEELEKLKYSHKSV